MFLLTRLAFQTPSPAAELLSRTGKYITDMASPKTNPTSQRNSLFPPYPLPSALLTLSASPSPQIEDCPAFKVADGVLQCRSLGIELAPEDAAETRFHLRLSWTFAVSCGGRLLLTPSLA